MPYDASTRSFVMHSWRCATLLKLTSGCIRLAPPDVEHRDYRAAAYVISPADAPRQNRYQVSFALRAIMCRGHQRSHRRRSFYRISPQASPDAAAACPVGKLTPTLGTAAPSQSSYCGFSCTMLHNNITVHFRPEAATDELILRAS